MQRGNRVQAQHRQTRHQDRGSSESPVVAEARATARRGIFPEIRIVRQASYVTKEGDFNIDSGIRDSLDEFGSYYHGDGFTSALGGMALSYATANEMRGMLTERHPRDFDTPGKARKLMRGVHRSIEGFIQTSRSSVAKLLEEMDDLELQHRSAEDISEMGFNMVIPEIELPKMRLARNQLWSPAKFRARGAEIYGTTKIGLNLDAIENGAIREEYNEFKLFLRRDVGLQTNRYMRQDFSPHLTFFRGNQPMQGIVLKQHVEFPPEIMLDRPISLVNMKK